MDCCRPRYLPLLLFFLGLLAASPALASWSTIDMSGPQIGLLAEPGFVDDDGEVERVETAYLSDGQRVFRFTDLGFELDRYQVIVIPELEFATLGPVLGSGQIANLDAFVQTGGVLVTFRDFAGRDYDLFSTVFGWSPLSAGATTVAGTLNAGNAAGTPFAGGPASLPTLSATRSTAVSSLPPGALSIYDDGTDSTVWAVRVGLGWVVSIGWDFFNAAPSGPTDGMGWNDVLYSTVDLARPPLDRDVAIFMGETYVDADHGDSNAEATNMEFTTRGLGLATQAFAGRDDRAETGLFADDTLVDYDPTNPNPGSEGVVLETGLLERGHDVEVFLTPLTPDLSTFTRNEEVLLIPELENGDLLPLLDEEGLGFLRGHMRAGGTLVLFGDANGRSVDLANALLYSSIVQSGVATTGSAGLVAPSAAGTPFAGGPSSIPLQSQTALLGETTLPAIARPIYTTTSGDVAAVIVPVWNGGLVWLGWDFFAAQPDGVADGGWRAVLDRALELRGSFETILSDQDVLVIPELERGTLEADLSPAARDAIVDYVSNGGRLVHGGGLNSDAFLNDLFGWSLSRVNGTVAMAQLPATVGTDFETGPASLPDLSANWPMDRGTLPTGSTPLYESAGQVGVFTVAVGSGEVVFLSWDFFGAEPIGTAGPGWVEVLKLAVPEPSSMSMLVAGVAMLAAGARRRGAAGRADR